MSKNDDRIYTDCSGDACPPDNRYDRYLTLVMSVGLPLSERWCPDKIAKRMITMALSQNDDLEYNSAVLTVRMNTNAH